MTNYINIQMVHVTRDGVTRDDVGVVEYDPATDTLAEIHDTLVTGILDIAEYLAGIDPITILNQTEE